MESDDMKKHRSEPRAEVKCQTFVAKRDVQGLLAHLQELRIPLPSDFALGQLGQCVRAKAKEDMTGLAEETFGIILGLGVSMLGRCVLHIQHRLAEVDRHAGNGLAEVPGDLIDERWLERAERLSRFCGDMAALHARVRHVHGLEDSRRNPKKSAKRPRLVDAVGEDPTEAGDGEEPLDMLRRGA